MPRFSKILLGAAGAAVVGAVAWTAVPAGAGAAPAPPPANGRFDYQIGGAYPPMAGITIVSRERVDGPAPGVYSLCYVNAFQTQPDAAGWWKRTHADLLLRAADGSFVQDPDWPGEILLDTSTAAKRSALAGIVGGWIADCGARGFQAVEPDNLDSYTRSRGRLRRSHNVAMATLLTRRAHAIGLAIGQKNTPELGDVGRRTIGFDFAVAEECQVYDECDAYTGPYGRRVIEIEYTDNGRSFYDAACAARGRAISVVLRDRDVVPAGSLSYWQQNC